MAAGIKETEKTIESEEMVKAAESAVGLGRVGWGWAAVGSVAGAKAAKDLVMVVGDWAMVAEEDLETGL